MKEEFVLCYQMYIHRKGADELLKWLETQTDFFTAPASTRFHLSEPGGLVKHSVHVFKRLMGYLTSFEKTYSWVPFGYYPEKCNETLAICGLLHDLCKANFYKTEMRNTKNENGKWIQVPYYTVEDEFPFGHGEKSVYLIRNFMDLLPEEAMAIRWHMGGFDDSVKGGSFALSTAFEKYPLALHLHMADLQATYVDER